VKGLYQITLKDLFVSMAKSFSFQVTIHECHKVLVIMLVFLFSLQTIVPCIDPPLGILNKGLVLIIDRNIGLE
jgi:hypothetical protein